jgi:hypothetical protein
MRRQPATGKAVPTGAAPTRCRRQDASWTWWSERFCSQGEAGAGTVTGSGPGTESCACHGRVPQRHHPPPTCVPTRRGATATPRAALGPGCRCCHSESHTRTNTQAVYNRTAWAWERLRTGRDGGEGTVGKKATCLQLQQPHTHNAQQTGEPRRLHGWGGKLNSPHSMAQGCVVIHPAHTGVTQPHGACPRCHRVSSRCDCSARTQRG